MCFYEVYYLIIIFLQLKKLKRDANTFAPLRWALEEMKTAYHQPSLEVELKEEELFFNQITVEKKLKKAVLKVLKREEQPMLVLAKAYCHKLLLPLMDALGLAPVGAQLERCGWRNCVCRPICAECHWTDHFAAINRCV